jgi:hypothetical protein
LKKKVSPVFLLLAFGAFAVSSGLGCVAFRERVGGRLEPLRFGCGQKLERPSSPPRGAIRLEVRDERPMWWAEFLSRSNRFVRMKYEHVNPVRHAGVLWGSDRPLVISAATDPVTILRDDLARMLTDRGYAISHAASSERPAVVALILKTFTWERRTLTTGELVGDVTIQLQITPDGLDPPTQATAVGNEVVSPAYVVGAHHESALNGAYCRALEEVGKTLDKELL